jgi:pimeloyl-ACP methyl ester carboxylesterase
MATVRILPNQRGELITVDDRRMHLVRAGPAGGGLTVLLEAGSFGFSADWAVVQDQLAAQGMGSLAYDRAGMGLSDPGPSPRDGIAIATDLEKLLEAANEPGPFILVGHSMAGLHVHLFAARNPAKVRGLVLVDAISPIMAADEIISRGARQYGHFSRAAAWAARVGLMRLASRWSDRIGLTAEAASHKCWAFGDAAHMRVAAEEVTHWEAAALQARLAGGLDPAWPVAVVTAGPARALLRQRRLQREPADGSRHGYLENVEKADHASLLGLRFADQIVRAIHHVGEAAAKS